jgi:hypothetical protein
VTAPGKGKMASTSLKSFLSDWGLTPQTAKEVQRMAMADAASAGP